MTEKLLKSQWYKFSDYEVIGNTIIPTKDSKLITYDPISESEELKSKKSAPIYKDILDIHEIKGFDKSINAWLKFAKKWGLPCNLLNKIDEIILHPQYLPFSNFKMTEVTRDHITPWENKEVKYKTHNFSYEIQKHGKVNTISSATEKNKKNLGKNYLVKLNSFSHALNKNDPNDLTWPPSNKVHLCPQQLIYKYRNGKWEFTTNFFEVKKIEKNAKPGDIISKDNIKGKYLEPGYFILTEDNREQGEVITIEIDKTYGDLEKNFVPFYKGKIFYKHDNKKIVSRIETDGEFTDRFPRICEILDSYSEKEYAENIEMYMWPFPGNENFNKNFGQDINSLNTYATEIWYIFKLLKDANDMALAYENNQKKELSDNQYNIIYSSVEKFLRQYTSKVTHTFTLTKNKQYFMYAPSLASYIGQIILQDISSSFSPRYCLRCERPIFNPSRVDQIWCSDTCGNAQRVDNYRKIKKLENLLKSKKISKKEFNKNKFLIQNNIKSDF